MLAYSKPWDAITGFANVASLKSLNALVCVISGLTHDECYKMMGKRNIVWLYGADSATATMLNKSGFHWMLNESHFTFTSYIKTGNKGKPHLW